MSKLLETIEKQKVLPDSELPEQDIDNARETVRRDLTVSQLERLKRNIQACREALKVEQAASVERGNTYKKMASALTHLDNDIGFRETNKTALETAEGMAKDALNVPGSLNAVTDNVLERMQESPGLKWSIIALPFLIGAKMQTGVRKLWDWLRGKQKEIDQSQLREVGRTTKNGIAVTYKQDPSGRLFAFETGKSGRTIMTERNPRNPEEIIPEPSLGVLKRTAIFVGLGSLFAHGAAALSGKKQDKPVSLS